MGAVEHFLLTRVPVKPADAEAPEPSASQLAARSSQTFDESEWKDIEEDLETEYRRLLPIVEIGLTSVISRAS